MKPTLTQLSEGFDRAISMGYCCNVSIYGFDKTGFNVTLTKYASGFGGTQTTVHGKGKTVEAAFQSAYENFPKNPLDGSQWIETAATRSITHED